MLRPLTGEPLSLDLINTCWRQGDREHDLLATAQGLASWLDERGLPTPLGERARAALLHTRAVLRAAAEGEESAEDRLNAVLARGLVVRAVEGGQVRERVIFADDAWALAWQASNDFLQLVRAGPGRIRKCEQPSCMLYFYDRSGRRRWCSMAGCGNRAKARRHHARAQAGRQAGGTEQTRRPRTAG